MKKVYVITRNDGLFGDAAIGVAATPWTCAGKQPQMNCTGISQEEEDTPGIHTA